MPKTWERMQLEERARMVLSMFPTLEPEVAQNTIGKWASREYPASWYGEQKAIDDLTMMLRDASMTEAQREADRQRVTDMVQKKLHKDKQ